MKCDQCQAEWTVNTGMAESMKVCPFCGADLNPQNPREKSSVRTAMEKIIAQEGLDVLRDGRKTLGLISDLAPDQHREKRMMNYLVQCDGHQELLDALGKSESQQRAVRNRIAQKMMDTFLISEVAAYAACDYFWEIIGGKPFEEEQTFSALFGKSTLEQLHYLEPRVLITIASVALAILASLFGLKGLGILAVSTLFVWGWRVVENRIDIPAALAKFSNHTIAGVGVYAVCLILSTAAGVIVACLGVGRWIYLKYQYQLYNWFNQIRKK